MRIVNNQDFYKYWEEPRGDIVQTAPIQRGLPLGPGLAG